MALFANSSYLIEQLAKEGFLIISVPYNVTFDHAEAAKEVYDKFNACMDSIIASGLPHANLTTAQVLDLPLFSVGHRLVYSLFLFWSNINLCL